MDCVTSPMRGQGFFSWPKGVDIQLVWTHQGFSWGFEEKRNYSNQVAMGSSMLVFERCSDIIHLSYTKKKVKTKAFLCFFHTPANGLFVFTLFLGCCSNHQFALRHVLQLHDFWIIAFLWKVIVEHHIIRKVDPTKGPKKGIVMFPENLRVFLKPTRLVCVWFPPKKKRGSWKTFKKKRLGTKGHWLYRPKKERFSALNSEKQLLEDGGTKVMSSHCFCLSLRHLYPRILAEPSSDTWHASLLHLLDVVPENCCKES